MLTDLLNDTLDPGYAQAAARRDGAGRPSSGRTGRAGPRWSRQLGLAAVLVLVGVVGAVTVDQVRASAPQREDLRQALITDIASQRTDGDLLADRLAEVREEAVQARDEQLADTTAGQRAAEELTAAEGGAALQAVTGPGLRVTLTDAAAPEDGGDNLGRILDRDIQAVVNQLWASGAEAIAIDGVRLGPITTIRSAGAAILVDFRPVTSPYEVTVIGDPEALFPGLVDSETGRTLASYTSAFGLGFDVAQAEELALDAGTGGPVRYAEPAGLRAAPEGTP